MLLTNYHYKISNYLVFTLHCLFISISTPYIQKTLAFRNLSNEKAISDSYAVDRGNFHGRYKLLAHYNAELVEKNVGIMLLNLGGPEKTEDVEGFLYNLFADPDIIRLPPLLSILQIPLAKVISFSRAPKTIKAYESIGGGSPIVKWTKAQAKGICEALERRGLINAKVYIAMRYWHPFTHEALEEIRKDNISVLVVLPLYPQFSISTSGSSIRVLREAFLMNPEKWGSNHMVHTVIPSWFDRRGYVEAMGCLIQNEIDKFNVMERKQGITVLFSAHGVPASYIEAGDPYKDQIEASVALIRKQYTDDKVWTELSYQSRVGPIEWLRPYTEDKIVELGRLGVKNLVVVPISFVSEHIETLEEIDIEYRELAGSSGIQNWTRVPALNIYPQFLEDLANLCIEALSEPSISLTEACCQNNLDMEGNIIQQSSPNKSNILGLVTIGSILLDAAFGKGIGHLIGIPM